MDSGLLLFLFASAMVVVAFFVGLAMALMYVLIGKRFGGMIDYSVKKGDDLSRSLDQVNRARTADSKELKERISSLEEKVELLARPGSREKEVALEKVFAKKK
ncbi:Uncharacterised protein [uncultured archaeon]|nr:Uncharacterised protein [uncultured archaeon]